VDHSNSCVLYGLELLQQAITVTVVKTTADDGIYQCLCSVRHQRWSDELRVNIAARSRSDTELIHGLLWSADCPEESWCQEIARWLKACEVIVWYQSISAVSSAFILSRLLKAHVQLTNSASEDYLWCALQIHSPSSSPSSLYHCDHSLCFIMPNRWQVSAVIDKVLHKVTSCTLIFANTIISLNTMYDKLKEACRQKKTSLIYIAI